MLAGGQFDEQLQKGTDANDISEAGLALIPELCIDFGLDETNPQLSWAMYEGRDGH